jgi:hypothetical protein
MFSSPLMDHAYERQIINYDERIHPELEIRQR